MNGKHYSEKLDERAEILKLENGLTVILSPKPGMTSNFAGFAARFGSADTAVRSAGSPGYIEVPDGTAHFLEHKLFDGKQGSAFDLFARTGASANAFTSSDKTVYFFMASSNFYESLGILLRFVTEPYFTEETVAKEQGIIGQEIKMYDDSPAWKVYYGLLNALYVNSTVRIDTGGTVESISKITPELLNGIYRAGYSLGNMALTISGDFDRAKVLDVCAECLGSAPGAGRMESRWFTEPAHVASGFAEKKMDVSIPLFALGYKLPLEKSDDPDYAAAAEAVCRLAAGESSLLYRELYDGGLINSGFQCGFESGRGNCMALFTGESADPGLAAEKLRAGIEKLAKGVPAADFERVKTGMCGGAVSTYNNVMNTGLALTEEYFSGIKPFACAEAYFDLTLSRVQEALKDFTAEACALSVVSGIEN